MQELTGKPDSTGWTTLAIVTDHTGSGIELAETRKVSFAGKETKEFVTWAVCKPHRNSKLLPVQERDAQDRSLGHYTSSKEQAIKGFYDRVSISLWAVEIGY